MSRLVVTLPRRIQRRRTKGWRMPEGAVYVGRPSRWGNPYLIGPVAHSFPSLTIAQCAGHVVNDFKSLVERGVGRVPRGAKLSSPEWEDVYYPSTDVIRNELRGHDLVCWCPLDQPCHADVLLELANT